MCPLFIVYALGLLAGGWPQNPALESQAVARIQQTPASQFDAVLPARPFGAWLKQLAGPQAGISWQLTDCGESPRAQEGAEADRPMCVEATAALADDRKIVVMISIGTVRQALIDKSRLYLAVVEQYGSLYNVDRLKDLPEVLKAPKTRVSRRRVDLPKLEVKQGRLLIAPVPVNLSASFGKPPAGRRAEEPPPPKREPRRVSEGVLLGNAINRVTPIYPQVARQINHSGSVVVEVVISEDGRVISATAISGSVILREAAETAARKWIFKPTILNGFPVQTRGTLTFVFTRH